MPVNRATFFFKDSAGYGWSETIHSLKPDLTTTLDAAKALVPKRVRMLAQGVALEFVRVSDDLVKRDSRIWQVPANGAVNTTSHATAADIANTCILVRMDGLEPTVRRSLYLRGQGDDNVVGGVMVPQPSFLSGFNQWKAMLIENDWALKQTNPLNLDRTITNISQFATTGVTTITTAVEHGFAASDAVTITGVTGARALNGSWRVTSVPSPTTFTIVVGSLLPPAQVQGKVKKMGFTLVKIADVMLRRAGHRIAGRPFDAPRGRRSARTRT